MGDIGRPKKHSLHSISLGGPKGKCVYLHDSCLSSLAWDENFHVQILRSQQMFVLFKQVFSSHYFCGIMVALFFIVVEDLPSRRKKENVNNTQNSDMCGKATCSWHPIFNGTESFDYLSTDYSPLTEEYLWYFSGLLFAVLKIAVLKTISWTSYPCFLLTMDFVYTACSVQVLKTLALLQTPMSDRICVNKSFAIKNSKNDSVLFLGNTAKYIYEFISCLHSELFTCRWKMSWVMPHLEKSKKLCPVLRIKPEWIGMTEYIIQNNEQLHEK